MACRHVAARDVEKGCILEWTRKACFGVVDAHAARVFSAGGVVCSLPGVPRRSERFGAGPREPAPEFGFVRPADSLLAEPGSSPVRQSELRPHAVVRGRSVTLTVVTVEPTMGKL